MSSHLPPNSGFDDLDLSAAISQALAAPNPVGLLALASAMAHATGLDPDEPENPFGSRPAADEGTPSEALHSLVSMMLETGMPQTDALLRVWARMLGDEFLRRRITTGLDQRALDAPSWVSRIDEIAPVRAVSLRHVLGHEETIFVEVSTAAEPFTLAIAIERSGSPFLDDAYPIDQGLPDILETITAEIVDFMVQSELSLADARARIEEAVEISDMMVPPVDTETWPSLRRLLVWMLGLMPAGGQGFEIHPWRPEEIAELVADFMNSPWAAGFGHDEAMHAERLFEFQANYGSNDPLRWGGDFVSRVMCDLYPRKVIADDEFMAKMPDTLVALVQYANQRSQIPEALTDNALTAIEDCMDQYQRLLSPGASDSPFDLEFEFPPGLRRVLEAPGDPSAHHEFTLELLADRAGGQDVLASLDTEPLPHREGLDTADVPADVLARVRTLAAKTESAASQYFQDPEMTTVAVRILARVAVADPAIFRRRFTDAPTVAALCWIAGKNNRWFSQQDSSKTVQSLMKTLGLTGSPGQRAEVLLASLRPSQAPAPSPYELSLGDPGLLTSAQRRDIIDRRDSARGQLEATMGDDH